MAEPAPENNPTPSNLTAMVLEVLKTHFGANSTQFKYSQNSTETKVAIQKSEAFNPELVQKRPAIYVKRGTIQINRDAISDSHSRHPSHGRGKFIRLSGVITVYCIAQSGGEVDKLTSEVLDCLLIFQTLISEDFNFLRFKVNSIGEVGILEDYKEMFLCPVMVEYDTDLTYYLTQEALPIRNLIGSFKIKDSDVENAFKLKE
jgi:hypothetical protein